MEKQKSIPQLRFPEFEGEWEKKTLGEIGEILTGKTPSTTNANLWNGDIQFVTPTDIEDSKYQFTTERTIKELPKTKTLPSKSIMFTCIASIGKMSMSVYPCVTNQQINSIIPFERYDPEFIFYALNNIVGYIKSTQKTNTLPIINKTEFSKFKISVSSLPEQQKIASFFTAIDQKISQLKHKKNLLEQYKKGVMQKIFSQHIRFGDDNGQEFPKWEKKKLGDVGKTYNGLTGKTKDDFGQGKPYIQYKQIFDDTRIDITRFDYVRIRDGEKQCRVRYGDVFFTTSSETPDEVGTSSVLLDEVSEVYLNSFCFGYRSSRDVLIPHFSRYLFRNALLRKEINKLAQGSTRYNISKNELMKTVIDLPTIQEQIKIANFLSAIDDKIDHTQKQIEKAEVWKKGLMQQMFC